MVLIDRVVENGDSLEAVVGRIEKLTVFAEKSRQALASVGVGCNGISASSAILARVSVAWRWDDVNKRRRLFCLYHRAEVVSSDDAIIMSRWKFIQLQRQIVSKGIIKVIFRGEPPDEGSTPVKFCCSDTIVVNDSITTLTVVEVR